ncbi:MAG: hypothetical protein ACLPKI_16720 [Streptosporangiaceae bacterium]
MQENLSIQVRLRDASTLPDTLAVSFDAFEAVRLAARSCVDRSPELFAAFMTTADAAVEGREAITAAPSLPAGPAAEPPRLLAAGDSIDDAIDVLAAIGALLDSCLAQVEAAATIKADRIACAEAAGAARRIHQLMTRGDDGSGLR